VKRQLQAEDKKISLFTASEIAEKAKAILMERPGEFIAKAEASRVVREELRKLQRKSRHMHRTPGPDPQAIWLCKTQVQNGAPE
jgi:hypothetical protein